MLKTDLFLTRRLALTVGTGFALSLLLMAALTFVGLSVLGAMVAWRTSAATRSRAASRFRPCVRNSRLSITSTLCAVSRSWATSAIPGSHVRPRPRCRRSASANCASCPPRASPPSRTNPPARSGSTRSRTASAARTSSWCCASRKSAWTSRRFPTSTRSSRNGASPSAASLHANKGAIVLHPGPMNRGVEITNVIADGPQSAVQQQVRNGVAVRMAVLATIVRNVQVRNVQAGRREV